MRGVNWIVALAGLGVCIGAYADNVFGPSAAAPEAKSFNLGKLQLTALRDAQFVLPNDGKTFGVGANPTAVSEALHPAP